MQTWDWFAGETSFTEWSHTITRVNANSFFPNVLIALQGIFATRRYLTFQL